MPLKCNAPSRQIIMIITLLNGSDINALLPWPTPRLTGAKKQAKISDEGAQACFLRPLVKAFVRSPMLQTM